MKKFLHILWQYDTIMTKVTNIFIIRAKGGSIICNFQIAERIFNNRRYSVRNAATESNRLLRNCQRHPTKLRKKQKSKTCRAYLARRNSCAVSDACYTVFYRFALHHLQRYAGTRVCERRIRIPSRGKKSCCQRMAFAVGAQRRDRQSCRKLYLRQMELYSNKDASEGNVENGTRRRVGQAT